MAKGLTTREAIKADAHIVEVVRGLYGWHVAFRRPGQALAWNDLARDDRVAGSPYCHSAGPSLTFATEREACAAMAHAYIAKTALAVILSAGPR